MLLVSSRVVRPEAGPPVRSRPRRGWMLALLVNVLFAVTAAAQSGSVSGQVVSVGSGVGIPAVTVLIPGTSVGTTTDPNGRFRLGGLTGTSVEIEVRRIGFRPLRQTVTVGATNLRIALAEQSISLDEVVITGTVGGQARR